MASIRSLLDWVLGRYRLNHINLLPLGSTLNEAKRVYGEPLEVEPSEEAPEITQYTFAAGPYHDVVASEWKGTLQSITYWSKKSYPAGDLKCVLTGYQDNSHWIVQQPGYWYQRADGKLRLWCSAIPAIGVAYVDFLTAEGRLKTEHKLRKLDMLPDPTWAANDVIKELQRLFVESADDRLFTFANRSDLIAVAPNGMDVLIIRRQSANESGEGFSVLNQPPDVGSSSTQVINHFSYRDGCSAWSRAILPRDAVVKGIRFDGGECVLDVQSRSTDRSLQFRGTPGFIGSLTGIPFAPIRDEDLWEELQQLSGQSDYGAPSE